MDHSNKLREKQDEIFLNISGKIIFKEEFMKENDLHLLIHLFNNNQHYNKLFGVGEEQEHEQKYFFVTAHVSAHFF